MRPRKRRLASSGPAKRESENQEGVTGMRRTTATERDRVARTATRAMDVDSEPAGTSSSDG